MQSAAAPLHIWAAMHALPGTVCLEILGVKGNVCVTLSASAMS